MAMESTPTRDDMLRTANADSSPTLESQLAFETRRLRYSRIFFTIFVLQLVANLAVWTIQWIPPTIGVGQYSIPINFRLLFSFFVSCIIAQLIVLALFLAVGPWKIWPRLIACVGTLFCMFSLHFIGLQLWNAGKATRFNFFRFNDLAKCTWLALAIFLGVAIIAWSIRIYRGKRLVEGVDHPPHITRSETMTELTVMLVMTVGTLFANQFITLLGDISGGNDAVIGFTSIGFVAGVILGGILFPLIICVLSAKSKRSLWVAILIFGLLILITAFCGYLSDYAMFLIPPGIGQPFFWAAFTFAILLAQLLLLRAMGYQSLNSEFAAKPIQNIGNEVVDPFGD